MFFFPDKMICIQWEMQETYYTLLEKYKRYIENDKIENYYDLNINVLLKNRNEFIHFLDYRVSRHYGNLTWLYFHCIYRMLYNNYDSVLDISWGICDKDGNLLNLQAMIIQYLIAHNNNQGYIDENFIFLYHEACKKGNSNAMNNLGCYYKRKKKYHTMLMYFNMAINLNNPNAMVNLGNCYKHLKKYDKMTLYYDMAIEKHKSIEAMYYYGQYYQNINFNLQNMVKYYIMAIKLGCSKSKRLLLEYCKTVEMDERNYYKYFYGDALLTFAISMIKKKIPFPPELLCNIILFEYIFSFERKDI